MGIKTRMSFKVAPGVRVNMNKKSTSITVGNKYVRQTISTGGGKKQHAAHHAPSTAAPSKSDSLFLKICGIFCWIVGILGALTGLISFPVGGWVIVLLSLPLLCLGWTLTKRHNKGD